MRLIAPTIVSDPRHGGQYAALLGKKLDQCSPDIGSTVTGKSWISQSIQVPSSGNPTLSVYYRIYTWDTFKEDKPDAYDRFEIYVAGQRKGVFGDTGVHGCNKANPDLGWRQFTYNLSQFKGQTIEIKLQNVTHPDESFDTWTWVDDIQVNR